MTERQPLLHDLLVALAAPTQAWSGRDGQVRAAGAQGYVHGDVRVLSEAVLRVGGEEPEPIAGGDDGPGSVAVVCLARAVDGPGADPTVRLVRRRRVRPGRVEESVRLESATPGPVRAQVTLTVAADLAPMEAVKGGRPPAPVSPLVGRAGAAVVGRAGGERTSAADVVLTWGGEGPVVAQLRAPGARAVAPADEGRAVLAWDVELAPGVPVELGWTVEARDADAVVGPAPAGRLEWAVPDLEADDRRLPALVARALADLEGLRMTASFAPGETFLAAGAPWFFTLFGRDSLWAARMLLPLGTELAGGTLRALAARQGTRTDPETAEQPGKILHEVRRAALVLDDEGIVLPPVYYGTVDATPLWVCVLHDAWRWGMPAAEVEHLLPHAQAALAWMAEHGDADGDGFLEYADTTGRGLANQGWKDSGDSIQWRDGRLARGPIALCEVQGYAHEAALAGAALLDAFGRPGGDRWRAWAARLADRFRSAFWVDGADGPYPAIALDADKRPVDTVTSNIGHLLGTGLLDAAEEASVAARLAGPAMSSGYGLRTLATDAAGYWPLRYHGGAVWPHDTAIVAAGLARSGHAEVAAGLVAGLLAAAPDLGYRLPELYGGDARGTVPAVVPYPAACRPQAWSAAAGVAVLSAALGLRPDVPAGVLRVAPPRPSPVGAVRARGLRVAGAPLGLEIEADGAVASVEAPEHLRVEVG